MSHEITTKAGNRVWGLLLSDREDEIEEADILDIEREAAEPLLAEVLLRDTPEDRERLIAALHDGPPLLLEGVDAEVEQWADWLIAALDADAGEQPASDTIRGADGGTTAPSDPDLSTK